MIIKGYTGLFLHKNMLKSTHGWVSFNPNALNHQIHIFFLSIVPCGALFKNKMCDHVKVLKIINLNLNFTLYSIYCRFANSPQPHAFKVFTCNSKYNFTNTDKNVL